VWTLATTKSSKCR